MINSPSKLAITLFLLTLAHVAAFAAGENVPQNAASEAYIKRVAELGEYRSLAEGVVLDVKRRFDSQSAQYDVCRTAYANAEEAVDSYMNAVADSVQDKKRSPELVPSADGAARAAEAFFACTGAGGGRSTAARIIPIAPFVEFAVTCLEFLLSKDRRSRDATAPVLVTQLRWRSWDRIR
jgi:hypothetical protein